MHTHQHLKVTSKMFSKIPHNVCFVLEMSEDVLKFEVNRRITYFIGISVRLKWVEHSLTCEEQTAIRLHFQSQETSNLSQLLSFKQQCLKFSCLL